MRRVGLGRSVRGRRDGLRTGTRGKLHVVFVPLHELAGESRVRIGDETDGPHPRVCFVEVPSELPHEVEDHKRGRTRDSLAAVH
jgi:hypothetical protein